MTAEAYQATSNPWQCTVLELLIYLLELFETKSSFEPKNTHCSPSVVVWSRNRQSGKPFRNNVELAPLKNLYLNLLSEAAKKENSGINSAITPTCEIREKSVSEDSPNILQFLMMSHQLFLLIPYRSIQSIRFLKNKLCMSALPSFSTRIEEEPKEASPTRKDLQIKQKKARLYDLKNKLLKYDSFEEIPIEELDNLCENLNFQHNSDGSNSEEEIQAHRPHQNRETRVMVEGVREERCGKAYVVKLKEVVVVVLVILCILVKNKVSASTTYDMGDFSIYKTRYQRSLQRTKQGSDGKKEGVSFAEKWLGMKDLGENVKLYLPKELEKVRRKEQRELTYQSCIDSYSAICIDHRLSLYGSMNLEFQDWIRDHISGSERVAFQISTEYVLSIVLSALRVKQLRAEGKPASLVTLIESERLSGVDLNSIKLSLIENECQDFVEIVRLGHQEYEALVSFQYVIASQEFYVNYANPFPKGLSEIYPNTSFLVYLPHGVNENMRALLKEETMDRNLFQIKFNYKDDVFYIQEKLQEGDLVLNKDDRRFRMILIQPKDNEKISTKQSLQPVHYQKLEPSIKSQNIPDEMISDRSSESQPQELSSQASRELVLQQHPCIQQQKYGILPVMSFFNKFVYINTIMGFRLLVSLERAEQYKHKGAISPELLFFISQNIKPTDVVLFDYQLYRDDLILLTLAKTISNKSNFYCITLQIDQAVLAENLRMNTAQDLVSYVYINMKERERVMQLYRDHEFTVFLTTFAVLARDYEFIFDNDRSRIIIFYWVVDINFIEFVQGLTKRHRVWAILERFEKMKVLDSCMNYGLMEVKEGNVVQMDRSWLVVQM